MNSRPLIAVVIIIVLLLIGYIVYLQTRTEAVPQVPALTTENTVPAPSPETPSTAPQSVTATYGASGFSPATVTVAPGTTVTWVNESGGRMWVAADVHPTHTSYDGTSTGEHCADGSATSASVFDQCSAGARYTFTFSKTGSFSYHNHAQSAHGGTVTVR